MVVNECNTAGPQVRQKCDFQTRDQKMHFILTYTCASQKSGEE